jgi:hypothetical protein
VAFFIRTYPLYSRYFKLSRELASYGCDHTKEVRAIWTNSPLQKETANPLKALGCSGSRWIVVT